MWKEFLRPLGQGPGTARPETAGPEGVLAGLIQASAQRHGRRRSNSVSSYSGC